jgi:hypothetical protein
MRLNISMDMRNLINLVAQPLLEASYKFLKKQDNCVAFYASGSSNIPSIMFYNTTQLMNADTVTVTLPYPSKIKDLWREAQSSDPKAEEAKKLAQLIFLAMSPAHMVNNREVFVRYPKYFRTVTLEGREKMFRYLTTDLKMSQLAFEKYFGLFKEEVSEDHTERLHNAMLIFPESMRESRKQVMIEVLEKTYDLLKKANLEKIFSGTIRCVQTGAATSGVYYPATQTMSVAPFHNKPDDVVATLIHEYAHKYWYEFMTAAQRDAIRLKYKELSKNGDKIRAQVRFDVEKEQAKITRHQSANTDLLKMGSVLTYAGKSSKAAKRGEKFVVHKIDSNGDFCIARESVPNRTVFYAKPSIFLTSAKWHIQGNENPVAERPSDNDIVSSEWFPTQYSTTSDEEWMAENFMLFVLGQLRGEPEKWWRKIIYA